MAKVKTYKTVCDICGDDTGNFHYYETHTNVFGVIAELSLWIDTCEACTKVIQNEIPNKIYRERYDSEKDRPDESEIKEVVAELKELVDSSTRRNEYLNRF